MNTCYPDEKDKYRNNYLTFITDEEKDLQNIFT